MIILGDIASPSENHSLILHNFFKQNQSVFENHKLVANLEGLICSDLKDVPVNTPILYNHPSIIGTLKDANIGGLGLANNHTLDLPNCFKQTNDSLSNAGIPFSGAGKSKNDAEEPFSFYEGDIEIVVFNLCWDFLLYHQSNPSEGVYIAELEELVLIDKVKECKGRKPRAEIVIYLHWSFDLETLPFPMYREFARLLVDAGATLVSGCHSHCIQGGEKYANGYIVYGLGNFFIPHNIYAGGNLSFPAMSDMQLAFEFDFSSRTAKCHWFKYDEKADNYIQFIKSEDFDSSAILDSYSPYAKISDTEYLNYFKKERRKKLLIPIYKSVYNKTQNVLYTSWLKKRATFLRLLSKYKIRGWQN